MDEPGKEGPHLALDRRSASEIKRSRFPIAVRVADTPDDLETLLDMGLKEHFRGR